MFIERKAAFNFSIGKFILTITGKTFIPAENYNNQDAGEFGGVKLYICGAS